MAQRAQPSETTAEVGSVSASHAKYPACQFWESSLLPVAASSNNTLQPPQQQLRCLLQPCSHRQQLRCHLQPPATPVALLQRASISLVTCCHLHCLVPSVVCLTDYPACRRKGGHSIALVFFWQLPTRYDRWALLGIALQTLGLVQPKLLAW